MRLHDARGARRCGTTAAFFGFAADACAETFGAAALGRTVRPELPQSPRPVECRRLAAPVPHVVVATLSIIAQMSMD